VSRRRDAPGAAEHRYRRPTAGELVAIGARAELELTETEAGELAPAIDGLLGALELLHATPGLALRQPPAGSRDPGRRPSRDEDPYNAFIRVCDVRGAGSGLLAGRTVGLKDNIDVAGIPTSNASATLAFTPARDAVVVERILAAGGRIVGKLNMDDFGAGASGETSAFGPPRNPHDPTRSAGGSSGGSGAALAAGAVDLALGVDQAGSARIPASFCGVVAVKATHGLIPSQGVTHLDHTLDAVCPMASTVDDAALLLQAIAGDDWRDPQWVRGPVPASWQPNDAGDVAGLRVGVVVESIDGDLCSPDVVQNLRNVADDLARAGCRVRDVSIPIWPQALPIAQTLLCHLVGAMIRSEGVGFGHLGVVDGDRARAFAVARRGESRLLPPYLKVWMLVERYLHDEYLNASFGMLQNLRLRVRAEIEAALHEADLLLTPTTPGTAPPLLSPELVAEHGASRILRSLPYNTAPLNLSGHPVLALPSGVDHQGLPTSVQLVAGSFREEVAIRAGRVVESALA
jgi:amidase